LDIVDIGSLSFLGELDAGHKVKELCSYYLAPISEENAKKLAPTEEVDRFTYVNKEAIEGIVSWSEEKERELDLAVHRMMFHDELEALCMAFDMLEEYKWNPIGS